MADLKMLIFREILSKIDFFLLKSSKYRNLLIKKGNGDSNINMFYKF